MTEKDLDSMATVQMKQEYAPSEVYSTASEPPPAYKHRSSSVQIAKICAFTVIVSSFIIGSFILASAYLQAKASCDQMQTLDSVLEKELMLETMQQELPRAEALLGKENEDSDFQSLDKEEPAKKEIKDEQEAAPANNDSESDSTFSESDESDDLQKDHYKVPLELDLSDLAAALLENNQKSRMNCVIERKHAVELVDSPARSMQLPFGVNLTTDPKKQRITGERISISCDSGNGEEKREETENIRPIFIPLQRMPIPFGPQPQQIPLTHMTQRMPPQPMMHQMPPPFQQLPFRPQTPLQFMQAPHPESQVRVHLQRIPMGEVPIPQEIQEEILGDAKEAIQGQTFQQPQIQVQRVPLSLALQRAGITAEDLRNIQRMAEERITDELRHLALEENNSNSENSESSEEDDDTQSNDHTTPSSQQPPEPQLSLHPPMQDPQILQMGRTSYGRSLPTPVRIPVPMIQPQDGILSNSEHISPESLRPHYVQPRSVRSVDNVFLHREKRVKRCACDCSC